MADYPDNPDAEDFGEETPKEESKEVEKEVPQKAEMKTAEPKMILNFEELQDFLSEINRMSGVIASTSKELSTIEKNTAVVAKFREIAEMDFSSFKQKFNAQLDDLDFSGAKSKLEDQLKTMDLERLTREAISSVLKELEKQYTDSNDLLKNLIYSVEQNETFKEKIIYKTSKKAIFASFVVGVAAAAGGLLYVQELNAANQSSPITNISNQPETIYIEPGAGVFHKPSLKMQNMGARGGEYPDSKYDKITGMWFFTAPNGEKWVVSRDKVQIMREQKK